MTDRQLDALYPVDVRQMSASYWTPVRVALDAVRMLVVHDGTRVLDIGSGAGKLCCIGAILTNARFHGIEQRALLVNHARALATLLEAERAVFTCGSFESVAPEAYDAFYLFNPFEENEDRTLAAADRAQRPGDDWFLDDVRRARSFLGAARSGARVVIYNGFGAALPAEFELVERVQLRRALELWVKRR